MAFSMGAMAGAAGGNPQAKQADDLEEINTERLSFASAARSSKETGTNKVKLLPSPWTENQPPSTSNLLAVASQKGLVAAAGPDILVIATTDAIRAALQLQSPPPDGVVPLEPQLSIPAPRLSQVAFTSDEQYLIAAAEQGGGLAVHEVASLLQGNKNSAFQLATEGVSVRSLNPNPAPELAENVAVVLTGGQLMIATLKEKVFVKTQNGAVLKDNVSCVSWSNKGKQLVAGLGDGTAVQMKPDGSPQALIPRPPALEGDQHISAIFWLANDDFLIVHTPTNYDPDSAPESTLHFVQREKGTQNYSFHKLQDPSPHFGVNRSPPHHFVGRLRNWKPNLDDLLIITSTCALDIGMVTRSSAPLSIDQPITNTYTTTTIATDSRRAQMPGSVVEEMGDTSPIGLALDLSSKEKVYKPIFNSDTEWSQTPLPQLMVLNNEGFLNAWWVVYTDAVETGTAYGGLAAVSGSQPVQQTQLAAPVLSSAFGKPAGANPAFGQSAFGSSGGTGGFGGASALGGNTPSWASGSTGSTLAAPAFGKPSFGAPSQAATPAFGKPAFGAPSQPGAGTAFGAAGGLGSKPSPWASQASPTPSQIPKPTGGAPGESGFAKFGQGSSPFTSVAKTGQQAQSGFGSLGKKPGLSTFGSAGTASSFGTPGQSFGMRTEPSFGSTVSLNSTIGGSIKAPSFGAPALPSSAFNQKAEMPQTQESDMGDVDDQAAANGDSGTTPKEQVKPSSFGLGASGFKIGSTFKGDGSAKDDLPKPSGDSDSFGLGSSLGQALGETQSTGPKTPNKFGFGSGQTPAKAKNTSTTPASISNETPKTDGGLFGSLNKMIAPASSLGAHGSTSSGVFGKPAEKAKSPTPQLKAEDAPLPPDFTKTPAKEDESKAEDAPLPTDFAKTPTKNDEPKAEDAPLPPDFTLPKAKKDEKEEDDLPPIAGSPPIKVEKPESPSLSGIPDETLFRSPPPATKGPFNFPPLEAGRIRSDSRPLAQPKSRSPSRSPVRSPSRPALDASTTPVSLPKQQAPTPVFVPPKQEELFRSPSPVRAASTSVISPGPRRQAVTIPPPAPISRATSRPIEPPEPEPVLEDLGDDQEFEATRAILSSSPRATTTLEEFYVHQDYAGRAGPSSIPGSIEQLYRDMQSMIDTVGLNAHHLAGFVKGHNEISHETRTREDLDIDVEDPDENDWVLAEIEDLSKVENGLERSLQSGRVADVHSKIRGLIRLSKDVFLLRKRLIDVRKAIEARRDPSKLAVTRQTPLSEEQSAQQAVLRTAFAETQKLLAQAEDGIVLLKTRITTASTNKAGGGSGSTPTAEAVENTIRKMTAMVEKKSGDLDVLETQMRKQRLLSTGPGYDSEEDEDIAAGLGAMKLRGSGRFSREGSPANFATPPTTRRGGLLPGSAARSSREGTPGTGRRGYGFFTPDDSPAPSGGLRTSIGPGDVVRSIEAEEHVSRDEVKAYVKKMEKRRFVQAKMREAVMRRGPRITRAGGK